LNLLAIDPGSEVCAFAYLVDGAVLATDAVTPAASLTWLESMEYIAEQLDRGVRTRQWQPDAIAIESVVFWRSASSALTHGMTIGFLARVVSELFPRTRWIEVNLSTIARELGLKANARREERKAAARERFPGLRTQDEADAAAIGITALAMLERAQGERSEAVD